ncbi:hypothetical protein E2C01_011748 [Portunus trituberculatus]|uniref:Uncharacterized protein n=1 Tax=Portunus trituberculatus TaxID=210409 RepID=A0A5B7DBX3_PORTR|nr:hypothetical protein [Portunus trituberculatus]
MPPKGRLWCVQGMVYRNPRPRPLYLTVTLTGLFLLGVTVVGWWPRREERVPVVTAGLASDDPTAVSELRLHWLDPPSSLPYNLTGPEDYISAVKGDTWPFIHHYIKRLFSGETDSTGKMM